MFIDVVLTVFCFTLFFLIWSQTMTSTNSTQMTPYRARRAARMIEKSNNQCNSSSNGYDTTVTPSLRTVTPSNCQSLVTEAVNNRHDISLKMLTPIDQTRQAGRITNPNSPESSWQLTIEAARYRSIILTSPSENIVSDLIEASHRIFHEDEVYRLFHDVADFCKSIPKMPYEIGETPRIPEIKFEIIPYDDDDTETIRQRVNKINTKYVGYYHDHDQYNINNAKVAIKLLDVYCTEEYQKYLSYINKVSKKLDEIVKIDKEFEELENMKANCEKDGVTPEEIDQELCECDEHPSSKLMDITTEVSLLVNHGDEIILYAQNLMKTLIEPLIQLKKHCSKCDAKMNQYMCEFNQLKEERERLRQKRESIVNTEHHCVCEQSSSTDCEQSSSTDTPQHSLIDLLEKYVQSDAFALSEFSKIYRTAFGTRKTQAVLSKEINETDRFVVRSHSGIKYITRK